MPKLQSRSLRITLFVVLVLALAAVRAFEDSIFYDPLLSYFRSNFTTAPLPAMDTAKLLLNIGFRFGLNTALSLVVLWVLFRDPDLVKFSAIIYLIIFLVLTAAFIWMLYFAPENKMALFYIRRFLIQPILLLLFIPAFYFQEHIKKSQN